MEELVISFQKKENLLIDAYQLIIVCIILMPNTVTNTNMTLLMLISAMLKQLIVSIECALTKRTFRMSREARFVVFVEGFITKLVMLC